MWACINIGDIQRKWCVLSLHFALLFFILPIKICSYNTEKEIDREQMTVESRKVTLASWSLCRCEQRAAIHSIHIYSWEYWITFATSVQLLVQVCTSRRWLHDTGFSNPYILPLMHIIRSAIRVFQQKSKKQKKKNVALMSLVSCSICVAPGALCVRCVEENLLQEHYEDDKEKIRPLDTSINYSKTSIRWIMQRQKNA